MQLIGSTEGGRVTDMPWDHVLASWPNLAGYLCADFNHLEENALRRFRGDRTKLVIYLAETHDLTEAEAAETLDHWLAFTGRRISTAAA